jgi:hypothetical protein
VSAPARAVTPYGPRRVLQRVGQPAPAVFGPSGVRNPLVTLLPAAALVVHGGTLAIFATIALVWALVALLRSRGRDIRASTVMLAVALTVVMSTVAGLASSAAEPEPALYPGVFDQQGGLSPPADAPSADAPTADAPPAEPIRVRTADDFMIPELRSLPVSRAPHTLPEPLPAAAADDGHAYEAPYLDRLPRLKNEAEAEQVLAAAFARTGRTRIRPDTAVLWLRVGRWGQVTTQEVISSTSRAAAEAARATVPYLRFAPGEKGGEAVSTWVTQRMVVVP